MIDRLNHLIEQFDKRTNYELDQITDINQLATVAKNRGWFKLALDLKEFADAPEKVKQVKTPPAPQPEIDWTIDWTTVNWDRNNVDLEVITGIPLTLLSSKRKEIGHKSIYSRRLAHVDWRGLDWNKANITLSEETGVSASVVSKIRKKIGAPQSTGWEGNKRFTEEKMARVDWQYTRDTEIADFLGISRERVRQIRAERNAPQCLLISTRGGGLRDFELWVLKNKEQLAGKYFSEICRLSPVKIHRTRARSLLKRMDISIVWDVQKPLPVRLPINWDLPSAVINAVWGRTRKNQSWAAQMRCDFKFPKTKYFTGYLEMKKLAQDKAFISLVSAEIAKSKNNECTPNWKELERLGFKDVKIPEATSSSP